jgi:hypothetical protein
MAQDGVGTMGTIKRDQTAKAADMARLTNSSSRPIGG